MRGLSYIDGMQCIQLAIETARKLKLPPISVVVLDSGGHIKCSASEDGVGILRHEIAQGKAFASLGMGMDTHHISTLSQRGVLPDVFINSLSTASHGKFNPNAGGAIIYENNNAIGAIGVSGGSANQDEQVIRNVLSMLEK